MLTPIFFVTIIIITATTITIVIRSSNRIGRRGQNQIGCRAANSHGGADVAQCHFGNLWPVQRQMRF